jgi:signal transduction histidine kinase
MWHDDETTSKMIMTKLQEHDELFREMIATLSAMTERLTNYPSIVEQTAINMRQIADQTKKCSELQAEKSKKQATRDQIKRDLFVGITVGVSVCILTALILGGVK